MTFTREHLLNCATGLAAVAALTLGAVRLHAYAAPNGGRAANTKNIAHWEQYQSAGHRMGSNRAKVTIVEFADFQCPYCQAAESTLKTILTTHHGDVALVYRHFPLPMHPYARDAARASECAASSGEFAELHDAFFGQRDSLGKKPWTRFASEAGIADTAAFATCIKSKSADAAISKDEAAARKLGVTGTPTFLVNDRLLVGFAGPDTLERYVQDALGRTLP